VLVRFDQREAALGNFDDVIAMRPFGPSTKDNACDSRKVCPARRANFGVFDHLTPRSLIPLSEVNVAPGKSQTTKPSCLQARLSMRTQKLFRNFIPPLP
jgi:hypothetical protein